MTWTTRKGIQTPKGVYVPKTDDLVKELKAAADFAELEAFNVKIGGNYVESETRLHTNSVAALTASTSIEAVTVEARDIAGR